MTEPLRASIASPAIAEDLTGAGATFPFPIYSKWFADYAAGAAASLPANTDYRVSIVNTAGANAYPISSFTWLLVYTTQTDAAKGKKLLDFVRWALTDGEKSAVALDYAPLPVSMSKQLLKHLSTVTVASK